MDRRRRLQSFLAILICAALGCKKKEDPAAAPPETPAPKTPAEIAEGLVGRKFEKTPELVALDEAEFLRKLGHERAPAPELVQLMRMIGWLKESADPEAETADVEGAQTWSFYSPSENRVYERKQFKNHPHTLPYDPAYREEHHRIMVVRAYVLALLRADRPRLPDEDAEALRWAKTETDASIAVSPLLVHARIAFYRTRAGGKAGGTDEEIANQILREEGNRDPKGTAQLRLSVLRSLCNRANHPNSDRSPYMHWLRRTWWVLGRMELAAAEGIECNPIGITQLDRMSYPAPDPPVRVRFHEANRWLDPSWKLVLETSLFRPSYPNRFALFEKGSRRIAVGWVRPLQRWSFGELPGERACGSGRVFLSGATAEEELQLIRQVARSVVVASPSTWEELEAFYSGATRLPTEADDAAALSRVAGGSEILEALPDACMRHPARAPEWIRQYLPALLEFLSRTDGVRGLHLFAFTPEVLSQAAWDAVIETVGSLLVCEDSGTGYNRRRSLVLRGSTQVIQSTEFWSSADSDFRSGAQMVAGFAFLQTKDPLLKTLAGLGDVVTEIAAVRWVEAEVRYLKSLVEEGECGGAASRARAGLERTRIESVRKALKKFADSLEGLAGVPAYSFESRDFRFSEYDLAPVLDGDALIVATNGLVAAFDVQEGKLLWKESHRLLSTVTALRVTADRVYIDGGSGLYCASRKDGKKLWQIGRPEKSWGWRVTGSLAIATGQPLTAYDLETGKRIWESSEGKILNIFGGDENGVVGDGEGGSVVCLDAKTGKKKWTLPGKGIHTIKGIRVLGGSVFVFRDSVTEVSLKTGKVVAEFAFVGTDVRLLDDAVVILRPQAFAVFDRMGVVRWTKEGAQLLDADAARCVAFAAGRVFVASMKDGRELWSRKLKMERKVRAVRVSGIVVVCDGDRAAALDVETGSQMWTLQIQSAFEFPSGDRVVFAGSSRITAVTAVKK